MSSGVESKNALFVISKLSQYNPLIDWLGQQLVHICHVSPKNTDKNLVCEIGQCKH